MKWNELNMKINNQWTFSNDLITLLYQMIISPGRAPEARQQTPAKIMEEQFTPSVTGVSGGRPAFSLFQLYRCMTLSLDMVVYAIRILILLDTTWQLTVDYYDIILCWWWVNILPLKESTNNDNYIANCNSWYLYLYHVWSVLFAEECGTAKCATLQRCTFGCIAVGHGNATFGWWADRTRLSNRKSLPCIPNRSSAIGNRKCKCTSRY